MNSNTPPTGDDIVVFEDSDYLPPMSKRERKQMLAREHNRAYDAGELTRKVDLADIIRDAVGHAKTSLGI